QGRARGAVIAHHAVGPRRGHVQLGDAIAVRIRAKGQALNTAEPAAAGRDEHVHEGAGGRVETEDLAGHGIAHVEVAGAENYVFIGLNGSWRRNEARRNKFINERAGGTVVADNAHSRWT